MLSNAAYDAEAITGCAVGELFASLPWEATVCFQLQSGRLCVVTQKYASGKHCPTCAVYLQLNDAPLAIVDKRRSSHNVSEVMNLIGDVKDKVAVLVDDMIDTAGTITNAAKVGSSLWLLLWCLVRACLLIWGQQLLCRSDYHEGCCQLLLRWHDCQHIRWTT